jgi:hypothetical protein
MPHNGMNVRLVVVLGALLLALAFSSPAAAQTHPQPDALPAVPQSPAQSQTPPTTPTLPQSLATLLPATTPAMPEDVSGFPRWLAADDELPLREPLPPGVDLKHPERMSVAQRLEYGLPVEAKYDVNRIGSRGIGDGVNFYSLERERALGQSLANQVERESSLVTDPVVVEYINRIGQNIVRSSDSKVPFVIKVVDNEEINAFALPGGYFYVNTGLILAADNEAELAGVMAHEIAHVAARHVTRNVTRAQIWNIASLPLIFFGGPAGYAIRQVAGIAVPMSFLKFSRDAEREADLLGLEYQYKAGYDPGAFVQFFEKLHATEKKKHSTFAKAFSTHPMNDERIKSAQKEIENDLPSRQEYVVTTSDFDEVKARLLALENEHHIDLGRSMKPVLRKRTHDRAGEQSKDKDSDSENGPVLRRHSSSSNDQPQADPKTEPKPDPKSESKTPPDPPQPN